MIEIDIEETTKNPISCIGRNAGICYDSNITDNEKNYKRGLDCLKKEHGEPLEFPNIIFVVSGYSIRVFRELLRHRPTTKLQRSTRYCNEKNFEYFTPENIQNNENALKLYNYLAKTVNDGYNELIDLGIPKEDAANVLMLATDSKVVMKVNLRELIYIFNKRSCSRAYSEIQYMMIELRNEISKLGNEWNYIAEKYLQPKCDTCNDICEKE